MSTYGELASGRYYALPVIVSAVLRINVDKYPKKLLWTIQILHHVASSTNMYAKMVERLVLPMQSWVKDWWVL